MTIRNAVVTAAGAASRMWPGSKVYPKELFPLGRIPAIVYLVWELADAGIDNIVFVVSGRGGGPLRELLDAGEDPPENVRDLPEVRRFQEVLRRIRYRTIPQEGPYGNGTPLINAVEKLGMEPCIYAFGDDIVLGENPTQGLLDIHARTGAPVVATQVVPEDQVASFGIAECRQEDGIHYVRRFVEKPPPGVTDSRLAALGRYVATTEVLEELCRTEVGKGGELWFSDALTAHIDRGRPLCALQLTTGQWYTVGKPDAYAEAVQAAIREQTL